MSYQDIPKDLKTLRQWVCANSYSKVPMRATEYTAASSTDPSTWSDYKQALSTVLLHSYDYMGFVFADNGIIGIDVDIGFDSAGNITPIGKDIMTTCRSYTERSKSGRGMHIFVRGTLPFKGKNNLNGVEIYKTGRFFVMTGQVLAYHNIIENQEAIDYILQAYFPEPDTPTQDTTTCIYNPIYHAPEGNIISLSPTYPDIAAGNRHISLVSLAGKLRTTGYNEEQIYNELSLVNIAVCQPPLPDREIKQITRSILKYRKERTL